MRLVEAEHKRDTLTQAITFARLHSRRALTFSSQSSKTLASSALCAHCNLETTKGYVDQNEDAQRKVIDLL
jgi:hypothetical protein